MASETRSTPAQTEPKKQDAEAPDEQKLEEAQEDAAEERKKGGYQ